MVLRLGLIGMSNGNGHPYSWSAICNGYNPTVMASCGFPAIPEYLKEQRFPEDFISDVAVTHIWTQDAGRSRHIADAAYVETVVNHYTDMLCQVDGILLARDDAETHYEFAAPFLEAGLPVYVDKPLALSRAEADAMFDCRQYPGQLFSCSALRYAKELALTPEAQKSIGRIRFVHASVPKTWDKYAVHVIEPILNIVGAETKFIRSTARNFHGIESVTAEFENGLLINIVAFGKLPAPIAIKIYGENGTTDLVFRDSFNAFKQALIEFSNSILQRDVRISDDEMMRVVDLIESGRKCLRAERLF